MSEFLILGTSNCRYCTQAKILLEDECIKYTYVDLSKFYHPDPWQKIFDEDMLSNISQRAIPLIFKAAEDSAETETSTSTLDLSKFTNGQWEFLGGFQELEEWDMKNNSSDQY